MSPAVTGTLLVKAALRDDSDLIRGYLEDSDEECFGALVGRYRDRVLRLAASILGPGAGIHGGHVVACATPDELARIIERAMQRSDIGLYPYDPCHAGVVLRRCAA